MEGLRPRVVTSLNVGFLHCGLQRRGTSHLTVGLLYAAQQGRQVKSTRLWQQHCTWIKLAYVGSELARWQVSGLFLRALASSAPGKVCSAVQPDTTAAEYCITSGTYGLKILLALLHAGLPIFDGGLKLVLHRPTDYLKSQTSNRTPLHNGLFFLLQSSFEHLRCGNSSSSSSIYAPHRFRF